MVSYTLGGLPGRLPYTGTRSPGTRLMHITRPEPSRPHAPAGLGVESLRASGGPPSNLPCTSQAAYPIPPSRPTLYRTTGNFARVSVPQPAYPIPATRQPTAADGQQQPSSPPCKARSASNAGELSLGNLGEEGLTLSRS